MYSDPQMLSLSLLCFKDIREAPVSSVHSTRNEYPEEAGEDRSNQRIGKAGAEVKDILKQKESNSRVSPSSLVSEAQNF